ncbi:MAG: SLC13 family permease [Bacteroidetes bacterium MedPE-SWsnd-G2]|nr:MAG: SLC13 family permease [Bacteroidetes bacterium MedPE-SWsnd-G2]
MTTMFIILAITIVLFIWGKYSPDLIAVFSMLALFSLGILTSKETLSGFSNPTVVMIAALFVIGEGLSRTGWTALAGQKFIELAGSSVKKLLVIVTFGAGALSGFVSNTGTVATLLPVTISSAWNIGAFPSKILMPVAFGSNTGGLLTLTGTPPNIIVSNTLAESGFEGFSFFEFGLIGLPLLIIAILYFRYVGYKLLPSNKTNNRPVNIDSTLHKWIEAYQVQDDYYRLRVRGASNLIGKTLREAGFESTYNLSVIRMHSHHEESITHRVVDDFIEFPELSTVISKNDVITFKGDTENINKVMIKYRLALLPLEAAPDELRHNLINQEVGMVEVIVTPKSVLVGRRIKTGDYFKRFGIQVLAVSRDNTPLQERDIKIQAGDAFLLRGTWKSIESLKNLHENIVMCGSPEGLAKNVDNLTPKSYIALGSLVLMIALLVFKVVPGSIAALISAALVIVTGCVPISRAYKSISWTSVIMIAAMIPMGLALQKTGAAQLIADNLVSTLGSIGPVTLLAGVFLLTTAFSQIINNSATAVLMAPIALIAAQQLNISPEPFMIVVAISASTAFLTPVGTTTNAMVMTAGGYKFMDYFKVGLPLLLIFLLVTLLLVPVIWPF